MYVEIIIIYDSYTKIDAKECELDMVDKKSMDAIFNGWKDAQKFSGVISVSNGEDVIYEKAQGLRNRSE